MADVGERGELSMLIGRAMLVSKWPTSRAAPCSPGHGPSPPLERRGAVSGQSLLAELGVLSARAEVSRNWSALRTAPGSATVP